jgi:hypothetical protein
MIVILSYLIVMEMLVVWCVINCCVLRLYIQYYCHCYLSFVTLLIVAILFIFICLTNRALPHCVIAMFMDE